MQDDNAMAKLSVAMLKLLGGEVTITMDEIESLPEDSFVVVMMGTDSVKLQLVESEEEAHRLVQDFNAKQPANNP